MLRYRALFISDIHLGTRGCQSRMFLDFLKEVDADTIYLVGDIVDGWRLKTSWYWPQEHNDIVQKLLRKVRKGVRLVYIPGNHDEFLRDYLGTHFGGIEVVNRTIHESADGTALPRRARRFLRCRRAACPLDRTSRRLGIRGGAAAECPRQHRAPAHRPHLLVLVAVGEAQGEERRQFHRRLRARARPRSPASRRRRDHLRAYSPRRDQDRSGIRYINCGDWVESCTAVVETYDGAFEIIRWPMQDRAPDLVDNVVAAAA